MRSNFPAPRPSWSSAAPTRGVAACVVTVCCCCGCGGMAEQFC